MRARFFAASGYQSGVSDSIWRPFAPGLSAPNQRLTNFCTLNARASARARARPPKLRASNPAERNFDDPISERSTYAVPQSVGMFAIKGSTTTLVKDDSAPGGAMIGAKCDLHLYLTKKTHAVLFCDHDFGCAKLLECQSIVQIILTTRYSTAPKNITSSWPAKRQRMYGLASAPPF